MAATSNADANNMRNTTKPQRKQHQGQIDIPLATDNPEAHHVFFRSCRERAKKTNLLARHHLVYSPTSVKDTTFKDTPPDKDIFFSAAESFFPAC